MEALCAARSRELNDRPNRRGSVRRSPDQAPRVALRGPLCARVHTWGPLCVSVVCCLRPGSAPPPRRMDILCVLCMSHRTDTNVCAPCLHLSFALCILQVGLGGVRVGAYGWARALVVGLVSYVPGDLTNCHRHGVCTFGGVAWRSCSWLKRPWAHTLDCCCYHGPQRAQSATRGLGRRATHSHCPLCCGEGGRRRST